ncbi:MAG: HAMP domain-containing sensor histidine kinase [bacterium]|jgi:two-component system sensor histidine kinase VicK|nr:HAMP domain-containing sensor histidine kinase [bacterium]
MVMHKIAEGKQGGEESEEYRGLLEKVAEARKKVTELEETRQVKKRYLPIIVHELKHPLQEVCSATGVLSRKKFDDPENTVMVKIIDRNVRMMVEMTANILKLEQTKFFKEIEDFSEIAVKPVLETVSRKFETAITHKGLIFTINLEPEMVVTADLEKLTLIFSNLIDNAVKLTSTGKITVTGKSEEGKAHFAVIDTGRGLGEIEQEEVNQIFKDSDLPGRRHDGTGIGLFIVKDFVSIHGGEVWYETIRGKGSQFHFTIPDP